MEHQAIVILDYNNVFTHDDDSDYGDAQMLLIDIIQEITDRYNSVGSIVIRAYGGWYGKNGLTRRGSTVMQKLSEISVNLFPVLKGNKLIRGSLELADQMYGVEGIWNNTFREKEGLPRLIVNNNIVDRTECERTENKDACPINIIKKFSKRNNERSQPKICHITNCQNNSRAFNQLGQKMVDSIMVCDILTYGDEEATKVIYVLTNDVDLFPAVVLCSKKHPNTDLVLKIKNNEAKIEEHSNYLHVFNSNILIEKL